MRLAPAFGLLLLSLPAAAQEETINCAEPITQSDMNQCAALDFIAADKALNALWPKVHKALAAWDRGLNDVAAGKGAEAALLKAQRAWIDYRDGQCEAEGFSAHGGSMEPLLVGSCKAEMTRKRTQELEALLQMY